MTVELKGAAAIASALGLIVSIIYSSYIFLEETLVTQRDRKLSDLVLLMAIDKNRITTLELHKATLTDSQQNELAGLRATVKTNECEYQKYIGLLSSDRSC